MKASDLRDEYRQAIATPLDISGIDSESGMPSLLFRNDWIRILLVKQSYRSAHSIVVELSQPDRIDPAQIKPEFMISTLIIYLQYLLRLDNNGFELEIMQDDILWIATLEISVEPKMELFEILAPP